MQVFKFIKGYYLLLFIVAIVLHILLALYSPNPNGYIYDFYSDAIILAYDNARLPSSADCWVCYHPPLLTFVGTLVFYIVNLFDGTQDTQLFAVASFLNILSLVFCIFTFSIYLHYRRHPKLDLVLWALVLFLPLIFISSFAIEADMLNATLVVISIYYFIDFLDKETSKDLIMACIFVGLASLTKYSGLVIALFYALVLFIRYLNGFEGIKFKQGLVYAVIVAVIGSYPYINNFMQHGSIIVGNKAWNNNHGYYAYNFKDFSIPRIVDVFTDTRDVKLKHYNAYNSQVLNSHYGQIWTDFSIFTRAYRHGQVSRGLIYEGKYMPIILIWAILIAGVIPVTAGVIGCLLLLIQGRAYILIGIAALSIGLYVEWFLGHNFWMLKSKYMLHLIPLWLLSIDGFASIFPDKMLSILLLPAVFLSFIYCFIFALF